MNAARPLSRLDELLADRASQGLTVAETAELLALTDGADPVSTDLAAASLDLAYERGSAALPPGLRERLLSAADEFIARRREAVGLAAPLRLVRDEEPVVRVPERRPSAVASGLGWLAAAAALVLAALGWMRPLPEARVSGSGTRLASFATSSEYSRFCRENPDVVSIAWGDFNDLSTQAPPEIRGVRGDVAWCDRIQKGYMRLIGLPPNDPTREQYQLWIVDGERGLSQRISGGVFNATDQGEVIVRIDEPIIPVGKAAAFAVTIEKPGGTWVSDMSRRVCLAARGG